MMVSTLLLEFKTMWHLIEDFFEQSWAIKAVIAWGWLSVIIMLTSVISPYVSFI